MAVSIITQYKHSIRLGTKDRVFSIYHYLDFFPIFLIYRKLDKVRLAEHNLTNNLETAHVDVSVDQVFVHENYNPPALYNNIAVVR
jgi:hypothetical protein